MSCFEFKRPPRAGQSGGPVTAESNHIAERSIRPIALPRKNALFASSDGGAKHRTTIVSLIEAYKVNDAGPLEYPTDIITWTVNSYPNSDIDQMLPWDLPKARTQSRGLRRTLTPRPALRRKYQLRSATTNYGARFGNFLRIKLYPICSTSGRARRTTIILPQW